MIEARKEGPWARVLDGYVRRKVRSAFRGMWLEGKLPEAGQRGLIVYCTHPGFWDGFIAHQVASAAGWDAHCMMAEENLRRYRFLARLGAFSVRREDPASVRRTFAYTLRLLAAGKVVFLFPEGELNPSSRLRPFARGLEVLARRSGAACLPLAIRYAFLDDERPYVLLSAGEPHVPTSLDTFFDRLSSRAQALSLRNDTSGQRLLLRGRAGAAERWDAVRRFIGPGARREALR